MSSFLSHEDLDLVPIEREDLNLLKNWRNDPELRSRTREWRALTNEDQERWFKVITDPNRNNHMFLCRYAGVPVGVVGLCNWNFHSRNAEVSFYIGDKESRGKGIMTTALELLIGWGFNQGLHRISAEVYQFNVPCINLLKKLGFSQEGILRDNVFRDGHFVDSLLMALIK